MGTQDTTVVHDAGRSGTDETAAEATLPRGSRVGRYLVLGELGRGGMGVVHRAYDPELDRPLAIKHLRWAADPDSPARSRLEREAQTLARLSDPHVVTIYDVGEHEAGLFIAMELIEGEDLAAWLARGPHPWPEVVTRFVAAGRGLAAAHHVGVVHRDFKPANVLLGRDGRVVVTDFGLARADAEPAPPPTDDDHSDGSGSDLARLTRAGVRVGTPAYMAPEQHDAGTADARSDQYAFCVALFEGLVGRRPFEGPSTNELASLKRQGRLRWPQGEGSPRVPPRIRRLLSVGLGPHPDRRFESMDALLTQLDPRPRWRGWIALGVMVLVGVTVAGLARSNAAEDPCASSERALDQEWSEHDREAMHSILAGVALPYAERAAESVVEGLDAWSEDFVETHRRVCEATWRQAEQSAAALDLRMGCLDDRRLALRATVGVLLEGGRPAVEHADALVSGLPSPLECLQLQLQPRTGDPSIDRTRSRPGSVRMRSRIAELDAMRRAGRGARALPEAEALAREVQTGLDSDAGASLHLLLGILRDDAGDFGGARLALQDAARLARTHGDPRTETEAWIELTRVIGTHQHDASNGRFYGELASSTATTLGDDDLRAQARLELGEVAFRSGDLMAAHAHWTEAEARWNEQYGPHDLRVARVRARLAGVDLQRGEPEAARDRLVAVVERYREAYGPDHPRVAAPLGNLGLVRSALGEHEAAIAHMREAIGIAERSRGVHHPQVAGGHDALGQALAAAGHTSDAADEFQAAVDGFERSLGPEHPALVTALTGLGRAQLELGQDDEAVASLERGLLLAASADLPPVRIADLRLGLARALRARQPERALQLARRAIEIYDAELPSDDPRRAELQEWTELDEAAPVDPPSPDVPR